jgi:hypothetical protein
LYDRCRPAGWSERVPPSLHHPALVRTWYVSLFFFKDSTFADFLAPLRFSPRSPRGRHLRLERQDAPGLQGRLLHLPSVPIFRQASSPFQFCQLTHLSSSPFTSLPVHLHDPLRLVCRPSVRPDRHPRALPHLAHLLQRLWSPATPRSDRPPSREEVGHPRHVPGGYRWVRVLHVAPVGIDRCAERAWVG